ncbi:MAG: hypothetical protein CMM07_11140 [Rhodopirellula sp.]|nr:hypothetical protein [Rhodopirellula sp.]
MDKSDPRNNQRQQQDDVDLTETCKNQCLQYLLGELAADQLSLFEERLGNSDRLADELQRQAEMIVTLSEVSILANVTSKPSVSTTSLNANRRSQKLGSQNLLMRGFAIAVAVCIAGFVFRTWWSSTRAPQGPESPNDNFAGRVIDDDTNMTTVSEATLIARAWAAAQVDDEDLVTTPNAFLAGTDVQAIHSSNDELELGTEATDDTSDDSFSWMFTAAFEIHEMETNDG